MRKMQMLLASALVAVSLSAKAGSIVDMAVTNLQAKALIGARAGLASWHVNDKVVMSIKVSFIKGTATEFVREDTGDGFWVQEDMDLGFAGKQKIEILFDKATGQIKKMLANGQEQTPPAAGQQEVVDMHQDHIQVAAGSFDCIYVKIKNKDSGDIQEAWLNPKEIPVGGILKALAPSQMGQVTEELQSFSFGN